VEGKVLFLAIKLNMFTAFDVLFLGKWAREKYIKGKWDGYLILRWRKVCEINKYVNFTSNVIITTKSC
jgi:hypothetical protein